MEPRITKRERRLHLSYELRHRVYDAQIYPITAPNGSTVIIYGHDNGLRILWRGGKRRRAKEASPTLPVSAAKAAGSAGPPTSVNNDGSSNDNGAAESKELTEDAYEDEEEELDPDCPYPPIIEDLDISVGVDVLHVAVPQLNAPVLALAPDILHSIALIAMSSADGALRVIQVPLEPPAADEKDAAIAEIGRSQIELAASGSIPADIAVKLVNFGQHANASAGSRPQQGDGALLVAAAAHTLKVWQIQLAGGELVEPEKDQFRIQYLPAQATAISFHPSSRSALLLLADVSGSVRIYDPFATPAPHHRPTSRDSVLEHSDRRLTAGSWLMTYQSSFHQSTDAPDTAPILAQRKKVLDARWIMTGKAVLALLEDGEWGIWELSSASNAGKQVEAFVFHGFLDSSGSNETSEPAKQKRGQSKLAPMTPNTRKAKSESLFAGAPKVSGVAPAGGLSVSSSNPRPGQADESVVMWYNGSVYSIASMQSFWQRSASGSGGGSSSSFGSLYAPGLAHVPDVNLANENITSVLQLSPKPALAGLGQMNVARDLLVSAERRLVVLQSLRPSTPSRALFQPPPPAASDRPASRGDQIMLNAGELDLGGMDRILDGMTAGDGRARKVGFAH